MTCRHPIADSKVIDSRAVGRKRARVRVCNICEKVYATLEAQCAHAADGLLDKARLNRKEGTNGFSR